MTILFSYFYAGHQKPSAIDVPGDDDNNEMDSEQLSLPATIHRLIPELVRIIEQDYGLLEELLSMEILDEREIAGIREGMNIYERNNRLLCCFQNKTVDLCQQFMTALTNTLQNHVVNFIERNGS